MCSGILQPQQQNNPCGSQRTDCETGMLSGSQAGTWKTNPPGYACLLGLSEMGEMGNSGCQGAAQCPAGHLGDFHASLCLQSVRRKGVSPVFPALTLSAVFMRFGVCFFFFFVFMKNKQNISKYQIFIFLKVGQVLCLPAKSSGFSLPAPLCSQVFAEDPFSRKQFQSSQVSF